ncbi:Epimerase domain-containing protein [Fusarium falciforme]|uniref:Epimerase domain-containing protein n=1 Tax=Fusarium falciforme TaxID=195108 RepID=UPI0023001152|nr:Epimerase domain-containing protein [Fusarium falciforme]WAO97170.1 Epimerase domain-containing protein [Fusarium falciforme]
MRSLPQLAVPKGSTVLVTGANGLLGSHIADQFLTYGYKVRGTVRDPEKSSWLADVFEKNYGKGSFELFKVPDMAAKSAFDEAVKGVSIVAHSASILSFDFNPHNVIPDVIAGAINALKAAHAESSVKRFVFTSSSAAAVSSTIGAPGIKVTEETWNEDAVKEAWAEPPYTPERAAPVYSASKTQAEQEVWKYHTEHQNERPDLVVNTVLPNVNFGKSVDPVHQGFASSARMPALLYNGQVVDFHHMVPRQYFIDTQDTGRLHVAAGIFDHVQGQRIFGMAYPFSWDSILEILRKIEPEKTFPENFSGGEDPNEIEPRDKAEQLLRELGRPGWTTLEESIRGTLEGLQLAEKAASA